MIKLAQVTQVYPATRTVDLVFHGSRLAVAAVQVLTGSIGSDHGIWDIPSVEKPADADDVGKFSTTGRNLIAVCGFLGVKEERPFVMGFLRPADSVVVFNQNNREVHLHPSGAYTTIAPDGSCETWVPGGGYIRVGTGGHENLSHVAANGWTEKTGPVPSITISNGKGTYTIDPSGDITETSAANFSSYVTGNSSTDAEGTLAISSTGNMFLNALSIFVGANGNTPLRLATEDFVLSVYNGHVHGSSPPPTPQATPSSLTNNLTAS